MEKYAVFLDIDGTLKYDGAVSQRNIQAIEKARKAGHKIFINTGRSLGIIPEYVREIDFDGFVAGIGSYVVCGGTELKREVFSLEETCEVARRLSGYGFEIVFEGEELSLGCASYCERENTVLYGLAEEIPAKYDSVKLTKGYAGGVLSEEDQKWLSERYNFFQHSNYAEFSHKGCTKAGGMKLVLDFLNIPVERCAAVGDSINDLDMLRFAGISVAMGNASDEIKAECTFVTETAENSGVALALEKILNLD